MIVIQRNTDENFTSIRAIAAAVWPIAYSATLSQEQLDYMMEMMYSIPSLQLQANEKKHRFILVKEEETVLGFASYEFNHGKKPKTKIHKIYILTNQGVSASSCLKADIAKALLWGAFFYGKPN